MYDRKTWEDGQGNPNAQLSATQVNDLEGRIEDEFEAQATALTSAGKGFIFHDDDPDAARPDGFASVEWHGSVEPNNGLDNDTWIDTSSSTMYRRDSGVWVPVTGEPPPTLLGPHGTPLLDAFNRSDQPLTAWYEDPQPDPSRWLPTHAAGSAGINTISSQRVHQGNNGSNDALTNWATPFSVDGQGVEVWCKWVQFPHEEPQGSYFPFLNPLVLRVGSHFDEPGPHGPSGAIDGDIRPYTLLVGRPSADNENWWDDSVNGGWIVLGAGTNSGGSIGDINVFETKTDPIPATVAEGDTWALSVEIAPDPDERTLRAWRRPADGEWSEVSNWTTPKPTAMTSNPDELDVGHIGFGLCGPSQAQDPLPIIDNFGGGEFT